MKFAGRVDIKKILLFLLFISSVIFHGLTFNRQFIGHHDFLNGHIAMTVFLWRKEGITKTNFAPVYSINSDIPVREGFGVVGRDGRSYYVSYPPFAFYLGYIFSFIPFLTAESSVKAASMAVFISCFWMLYYFLRTRFNSYLTLIGLVIYSTFPISAYFLGNVFFVDIAMLPFWFLAFLVFLKLSENRKNIFLYYFFFLLIFIISFTEWFGLLLSFCVFIYVLSFGRKLGWSPKYSLSFIINTLVSSLSAYLLTALIFLSRIEPNVLGSFLYNKFLFRSNISSIKDYGSLSKFVSTYWEKFYFHINLGFGYGFKYLLIAAIIIAVIGIKMKVKMGPRREIAIIMTFFFLAPFLHYVSLNQFHYWHDFGNLYAYFSIILIFVYAFKVLFAISDRLSPTGRELFRGLSALTVAGIIITTSLYGYKSYFRDWIWMAAYYPQLFGTMKDLTGEHDLILTNQDYSPINWYYYQRNVIGPVIGPWIADFKAPSVQIKNIYYMSDGEVNAVQSCGGKKIENQKGIYYCKIN